MELLSTPIDGLVIRLNKVISDDRGVLCELSPGGSKDPLLAGGIGNIYASMAIHKGIMRAGHYHLRAVEEFFTLSGSALWFFKDLREGSPTRFATFSVIAGLENTGVAGEKIPAFAITGGALAQFHVPPGIYHAVIPLTEGSVMVMAIASEPYDPSDYVRPEVPEMEKLLAEIAGEGSP